MGRNSQGYYPRYSSRFQELPIVFPGSRLRACLAARFDHRPAFGIPSAFIRDHEQTNSATAALTAAAHGQRRGRARLAIQRDAGGLVISLGVIVARVVFNGLVAVQFVLNLLAGYEVFLV